DLGAKCLVGEPGLSGEGAAQGYGEPAPQLRRIGIEQDRAGVVVAIGAQRLSKPGIVAAVPLGTGQPVAMWANLAASAGSATQESAVLLPLDVNWVERGCRQRGEHARMGGDSLGDALAVAQPSADELVGVCLVDLSTGRTLGCPAGFAGDRQRAAGFVD